TGTVRSPDTLRRLDLRLRGTEAVDGAAHTRPIGAVEREERRKLPVAAGLDIGIDEGSRQVRAAEPRQVHGEEGDGGSDVGAAERERELDAVDDVHAGAERRKRRTRRHGRGEKADMLGAEIAVTLPDAILGLADREERRVACDEIGPEVGEDRVGGTRE